MVDLTDLTPATSEALARLKAGLAAQGFQIVDPISAFRTYEDQRQLYANYQAGRAGQALPYPDRGAVALAARPGYSPHESGVAFDLGLHGAALEAANKLAPGLGLSTIAGDPGHYQLASWQGAGGGANAAPPSRPATLTPGVTLNTSPMDLVANVESGNRNIPQAVVDKNTAKGTPAGGYFQIIDPTWRRYAGTAGVDLNQYPTAMSAPRNIQAQVASAIPVNQWGPNTVAALQKQFPGIDTSKTLGEVQSAALGGSLPATTAPAGTTVNTTGNVANWLSSDQGKKFEQSLSDFDKSLGGRGLGDQQGQQGDQQQQLKPPQIMGGPGLRNYPGIAGVEAAARQLEPQLTHYSPGLYGQSLNSQPLSWGSSPIPAPNWLTAGQQQQAQGYGTNLNSLQMAGGLSPYQLQMMMNPMMLDQGGGNG